MSSTTVVHSPVSAPTKITETWFRTLSRDYHANRKLVDCLKGSENPDNAFATAQDIIARLGIMVEIGSDYTPPAALGFGSGNSSTLASGVLGLGLTGSQICKKFSDFGKPIKG